MKTTIGNRYFALMGKGINIIKISEFGKRVENPATMPKTAPEAPSIGPERCCCRARAASEEFISLKLLKSEFK